jgi:fido (protein-threonine AMPylation protein)
MEEQLFYSSITGAYHPRWDLRTASTTGLSGRARLALDDLLNAEARAQLSTIQDTRNVHQSLFLPTTPKDGEVYAGTYRGTPGTFLEDRRSHVRAGSIAPRRIDKNAPPHRIEERMASLGEYIEETWNSPSDIVVYYLHAVRIFHRFVDIHPYVDGNGHTARLIFAALLHHRSIALRPTWTIHPRPYSNAISLVIQLYSAHPDLLALYLGKWVGGGLRASLTSQHFSGESNL